MNYEEAKRVVEGYKVSLAVEGMTLSKEAEELAVKVGASEIAADAAVKCVKKRYGVDD